MRYQNVENFLQNKNIPYKQESNGRELRIICPFCKHPKQKCYIHSSNGCFYCFHCGQYGSWKGLVERLGDANATIPEYTIKEDEEPDLPPIDPEIVEEYHKNLLSNFYKGVKDYLYTKRGYTDETIEKFKLGWNGKSITIPIFNAHDECMNFKLKSDPTLPIPAKGMYSIVGRGKKRLFNEGILKDHLEAIIISEGEWDCIKLNQEGFPSVTSTTGANSFDQSWIQSFNNVEKIFLCFDIDRNGTGQQAAKKTAQLFYEKGIETYIVDLGKLDNSEQKNDITDFFLKHGEKALDKFSQLLQNAKVYVPKEENKAMERKTTVVSRLVRFTLDSQHELFFDEFRQPHISFSDQPFLAYPVKNSELKQRLAAELYRKEEKGFSGETFQQIVNTLEGIAFHKKIKQKLFNRVARIDNTIYYDLADDQHIVVIDQNGWEITTKAPVKFKRFAHQEAQVMPEKGGNLFDLLPFINLHNEEDKLLLLTHCVATLIPGIPRAGIATIGDKGSAKSTALRLFLRLIDPTKTDLLKLSNDIDQIILNAN